MPSGVNTNDIRAFIREYEINSDVKVDAVLVDYLDLMMPISAKISPENLFVKDKYVSEELRNLAAERDLLLVTASQLGRSAVEEIEFDHSHIAGGISKIQTADNVVGIFTSNAMRERGRYQIQFMKTRSSSGVGSKVDLKFNPDTLRIEDLDEDDEDAMTVTTSSLVPDEVPDPPDDDVAPATDESGGLDIGAAGTERLVGHDEETHDQQTEDRATDVPRQSVRKDIEHVRCLSSGERERSGRLGLVRGGPGAVAAEQIGDVGESGRDEAAGTDRRAVAAGAVDDGGLRGIE